MSQKVKVLKPHKIRILMMRTENQDPTKDFIFFHTKDLF